MLGVQMFDELGDDLRVRLRFKLVALVLQEFLDIFVVGDDA